MKSRREREDATEDEISRLFALKLEESRMDSQSCETETGNSFITHFIYL